MKSWLDIQCRRSKRKHTKAVEWDEGMCGGYATRNINTKHKTETHKDVAGQNGNTKETETGSGLRGMCGGCATQQHSSTNVLLPSQNTKHKRWLWQQHLVLTQAHKTQNCFKKENTMSSLEECGQPVCIMQASTTWKRSTQHNRQMLFIQLRNWIYGKDFTEYVGSDVTCANSTRVGEDCSCVQA